MGQSNDLERRLFILENREAIRTLKAKYLRACDLKRVDDFKEIFTPEGVLIHYEGLPEISHRDDFIATFETFACRPGVYDIHHATNSIIDFETDDEATGQWSLHFKSIVIEERKITTLGIDYNDKYVRRDGRWWISETRAAIHFCLIERIGNGGISHYTSTGHAGSFSIGQ